MSVLSLLDRIVRIGCWLPVILTGYFFFRWLTLPTWLGPILIVLIVLIIIWQRTRISGQDITPSFIKDPPWTVALFVGLLLLLLFPSLRVLNVLAVGSDIQGFLFDDEAYSLMIARSLSQGFPPQDLSYSGNVVSYHLGGPLLVEMIHRYTGLTLHSIFYGLIPIVAKLLAFAASVKILTTLLPGRRPALYLLGAVACAGVFILQPYNIIWNLRNGFISGFDLQTWLFGMPSVYILDNVLFVKVYYAFELATLFTLLLFANLERLGAVSAAAILFAIFLVKVQVFLVVGAGWGIYTLYRLRREQDGIICMIAGGLALAMALLARQSVMALDTGHKLNIGPGPGWVNLQQWGAGISQQLGIHAIAIEVLSGFFLLLIGLHFFVPASIQVLGNNHSNMRHSGKLLLALIISTISVGLIFSTLAVIETSPLVKARYDTLHTAVADFLWTPVYTYVDTLSAISIAVANHTTEVLFSLCMIGALIGTSAYSRWTSLRWAAGIVLTLSCTLAAGQIYNLSVKPVTTTLKIVSPAAKEALQSIPLQNSLILTNDLTYGHDTERWLPLMNPWLPAQYGHHFWVSNLMYGTANYIDKIERFETLAWFWQEAPSLQSATERCDFLKTHGISHLLQHVEVVDSNVIGGYQSVALYCAQQVFENPSYVVYQVKFPDADARKMNK